MDLMVNYLQEKYSVSVLFSVYGYKQTVSNSDTRKIQLLIKDLSF